MQTLKKRQNFLTISNSGFKWVTPGFVMQMGCDFAFEDPQIGFTASRKVGGAVQRNRAKRRLRALANEILVPKGRNACGYVLIARQGTLTQPFDTMRADMTKALKRLHSLWDEEHAPSP